MEDNRQTMELQMSETSRHNLGSTSSGQRSSSATADSASTSSGVGSIASSSVPPNFNDAGDSGCHPITIGNSDASNGRDRQLDDYLRLLRAALKGDWPSAKTFYDTNSDCVRASITMKGATALHLAVGAQHSHFIKKWLKLMSQADLELKNDYGFTALHNAAQVGNVSIAEQLVIKNVELPSITNCEGDTPLIVAAYFGHTNMVSYLFSRTSLERLNEAKRIELLHQTIRNDMYYIALQILKKYPNITNAGNDCGWKALEMLAKKPFSFGNERELSFWKHHLNSWFEGICHKALMKTFAHKLVEILLNTNRIKHDLISPNLVDKTMALIFEAVKVGNVEFLIILSRFYPSLIWQKDNNNMSIFHKAILCRQESVFSLIYEIGLGKDNLASYSALNSEDNMLHLAGQLASSDRLNIISGAALQMQRELLWFKEIEKIVHWSYVNDKNSEGLTPREIFIKEHKHLQKDGEKWMKDTSQYCMLIATLIATVIFAAAFTVPGGSNQVTGTPIFFENNWFMVFFISDAISLCSSLTSVLIFLSILTSRYTRDDFLRSLPSKLLFGLATLFISMAGMMVAFISTFFVVYTRARAWSTRVVVIISAIIPIIVFCLLHCRIWLDTILSTYKSRVLFRPYKHKLF